MKKVMIGLIGCSLLGLLTARPMWAHPAGARYTTGYQPVTDTTGQTPGHTIITRDTLAPTTLDTSYRYRSTDTGVKINDTVISLADDAPVSPAVKKDSATDPAKTDPAKTDPAKADAAKADSVKPDATATDATKAAEVKTDPKPADVSLADSSANTKPDAAQATQPKEPADTTSEDRAEQQKRELDRRWFIAPLTKFQFQDFALLEKNRKGYLSDANNLPFFQRGNASFAASAYKNLTNRLSVSADIGLSFGHATSNDVLISQTKSKTYNLLNAALYYHLISPAYRLQPYVTVGFNDIINDKSYPTVPLGVGAKFNSRKIMVLGEVSYGQSISKNVASTTMYSLGIYIPIKSKKQKQLDQDENSKYDKKDDKKKDTANKNGNGNVTNNIYITINMDSVLKAKGLLDDNGNPFTAGDGRRGRDGADGADGDDAASAHNRRKKPFRAMGLDDFNEDDYRIDSLDGKPVIRFVVYFEFNDYGLNSKAFGSIDKVIRHLKSSSEFSVEIKGYTDSVGTNQYNNVLSRKRAKMILDYMNSRGVPADLMKAKAYGSDDPVADNSDPNQAWLNRRAEIIVHKKELAAQ
ncbi:OmpA family protein [Puia sp.]|jgi:outer membrane protein OmpA-like peptidoglycan-associated protein|uniref:OmpA family protein n=1 Tax=Puia sp. TaxID=2045100 RepID=UPI002F3EF26B